MLPVAGVLGCLGYQAFSSLGYAEELRIFESCPSRWDSQGTLCRTRSLPSMPSSWAHGSHQTMHKPYGNMTSGGQDVMLAYIDLGSNPSSALYPFIFPLDGLDEDDWSDYIVCHYRIKRMLFVDYVVDQVLKRW
ncbi:hypothetical protein EDB19DRAFT_986662 [Suillus lakei]|nr:hypothetical protein EDB19DRAFT_986662 [Suillus lakei]